MWTWIQSSGKLLNPAGELIAKGYSGKGEGKNNPEMQEVHEVGPIPVGEYTIGEPFHSATHGPFCLPLTPDSSNQMFGRSSFLIHGDSIQHPGEASKGCIILPRFVREAIHGSGERRLRVVRD